MSKTPDGGVNIEVPVDQMEITGYPPTVTATAFASTAAVAPTSAEANAIVALGPTFRKLDDAVVYVLAHDKEPVGPRVGELEMPETTAKALANYEWLRRVQGREGRRWGVGQVAVPLLTAVFGGLLVWLLS